AAIRLQIRLKPLQLFALNAVNHPAPLVQFFGVERYKVETAEVERAVRRSVARLIYAAGYYTPDVVVARHVNEWTFERGHFVIELIPKLIDRCRLVAITVDQVTHGDDEIRAELVDLAKCLRHESPLRRRGPIAYDDE